MNTVKTEKSLIHSIEKAQWFFEMQGGVISFDFDKKSQDAYEGQNNLLVAYAVQFDQAKNDYREFMGYHYDPNTKITKNKSWWKFW